jgi:hypothetical protein
MQLYHVIRIVIGRYAIFDSPSHKRDVIVQRNYELSRMPFWDWVKGHNVIFLIDTVRDASAYEDIHYLQLELKPQQLTFFALKWSEYIAKNVSYYVVK